jgi:uncharacterized protein YndB with AHSA1/START domain
MADFEERAVCRAPAIEVFKLLHDPSRFPEWWEGMDRVEGTPGSGDGVSRFMREWPDFAYPMEISHQAAEGAISISCLLSDIVHEWRIAPHPEGCVVGVAVELPEAEAGRAEAQRAEVGGSLRNLVALAEAEDRRRT